MPDMNKIEQLYKDFELEDIDISFVIEPSSRSECCSEANLRRLGPEAFVIGKCFINFRVPKINNFKEPIVWLDVCETSLKTKSFQEHSEALEKVSFYYKKDKERIFKALEEDTFFNTERLEFKSLAFVI